MKNYSTMCRIKIKRNAGVRKSCIRGFTGHYWLSLVSKRPTIQRNQEDNRNNNKEIRQFSREICDVCGQSFSCVGNLNRHKRLHTEYQRLQCDVCLRTYSNMANFKNHISRHHPMFGIEITWSPTTEGAKQRPTYSNWKIILYLDFSNILYVMKTAK